VTGAVSDPQSRDRSTERDPDPEAVVERIRERAARIREREVDRAVKRMAAAGGLTEPQCETVRAMGESLTASLVDPPVEGIEEADDEETLATAVELFEE
jgi:glutamyl-tRNA reductase